MVLPLRHQHGGHDRLLDGPCPSSEADRSDRDDRVVTICSEL
jgi:hypothetical protein